VLALEIGANVEDLALTIHGIQLSGKRWGLAEMIEGTITDLYIKKR
jgi:hypothetical protein